MNKNTYFPTPDGGSKGTLFSPPVCKGDESSTDGEGHDGGDGSDNYGGNSYP